MLSSRNFINKHLGAELNFSAEIVQILTIDRLNKCLYSVFKQLLAFHVSICKNY